MRMGLMSASVSKCDVSNITDLHSWGENEKAFQLVNEYDNLVEEGAKYFCHSMHFLWSI